MLKIQRSSETIFLERLKPRRTILLGHSMGGLIALYYVVRYGDVDALILSAAATEVRVNPLIRMYLELMNILNPRYRIRNPVDPHQLTHDKKIAREYIEDKLVIKNPCIRLLRELVRASKEIWKYVNRIEIPLLIMHGTDDKIIPSSASSKLYELVRSRDKTLKLYEGMRHELLNEVERNKVLGDIISWIRSRFANQCSSGMKIS